MKITIVDDDLYSDLEAAADRSGRSVQELVHEAIVSWLGDAAMDYTEYAEIEQARVEAAEQGGVEFEAFFNNLSGERA